MKLKLVFIFFFFISFLYGNEKKLIIGILYEKIFTTKKEARIGSELWIKQMEEKDPNFKLGFIFYKDEENFLNDYKNEKISIILSNATLYYENKKLIDSLTNHRWIMSLSNEIFDSFYLIKNKKSTVNLNNLENQKILYKDEMAKIWLDSLLHKSKMKHIHKNFEKIKKENKLIFSVFFNKNKLSIISKNTYDTLVKLNPQIKSKTEIIKQSDSIFFNGIGFTRKNLSQEFENMLELMRINFMKKENDFSVLSFTDIQKTYVLKKNDLNKLDEFYEEYFKIKNHKK